VQSEADAVVRFTWDGWHVLRRPGAERKGVPHGPAAEAGGEAGFNLEWEIRVRDLKVDA
jgi:hypothetical protein